NDIGTSNNNDYSSKEISNVPLNEQTFLSTTEVISTVTPMANEDVSAMFSTVTPMANEDVSAMFSTVTPMANEDISTMFSTVTSMANEDVSTIPLTENYENITPI